MAMSPEERRAKDAERKRKARAAAAEKREAERAAARTAADAAAPRTQRDAVEATIAAAKWLTDADAASIAQARQLAETIDLLGHEGDRIRLLSAHRALSQVMNDLGATATKRLQYELRSRKAQGGGDDGGEHGEAGTTGGNVTQLRRPAKRRA